LTANGARTMGRPARINFQQRRLLTEESSRRTDELIAELPTGTSSEMATAWAQHTLPEKNRLQVEDATRLEEAIRQRMGELDRVNLPGGPAVPDAEVVPAPEPAPSPQPPGSMLAATPPEGPVKLSPAELGPKATSGLPLSANAEPVHQGRPERPDDFPQRLPV